MNLTEENRKELSISEGTIKLMVEAKETKGVPWLRKIPAAAALLAEYPHSPALMRANIAAAAALLLQYLDDPKTWDEG